jgi:anti-sigma factor RsiW
MSNVICRLVSMVPADMPLNRVLEAHRDQCPRCQADVAHSTGMSRELSAMGGETLRAPEGLATTVMSRLPEQDGSDPRRPLVVRIAVRYSVAAVIGVATVAALMAKALSRRE